MDERRSDNRDLPDWTSSQWAKWAVFGVVAGLVGLLGFAVSAQFEPTEFLPTNAVAAVTTSTLPVGDSRPEELTTTSVSSEPLTTAETSPASFELSVSRVDFGEEGNSAEFELANVGGQSGAVALGSSTSAISLSTGEAQLGPGEAMAVQLSLDRAEIGEGAIDETITVTWEGGQLLVAAIGLHVDNPIIHNPKASPAALVSGGDCGATRATVSARVRDSSELASVVARWGGTETTMNSVGNDIFEAQIGPYTSPQTASVRIVATDVHGNAGGAVIEVEVTACP